MFRRGTFEETEGTSARRTRPPPAPVSCWGGMSRPPLTEDVERHIDGVIAAWAGLRG